MEEARIGSSSHRTTASAGGPRLEGLLDDPVRRPRLGPVGRIRALGSLQRTTANDPAAWIRWSRPVKSTTWSANDLHDGQVTRM